MPLDQFCELSAGLSVDDPLPHCASCRENGVPQAKFLNLTPRHLKAIDVIIAGPTYTQGLTAAAAATGYSRDYLKELFHGRRIPEFRRCFQMKLEAMGASIDKIIQVKVGALDADEQKWNPAEERFNAFPDWRTRLRASQDVAKLLEMEPPKDDSVNVGVAIKIETNLGDGETIDPPNIMRPKPLVVDVNRAEDEI